MSALVCGKRSFLEDPAYGAPPCAKRMRYGNLPARFSGETVTGFDEEATVSSDQPVLNGQLLAHLKGLFPTADGQLLEGVLRSSGYDVRSAVDRLNILSSSSERNQSHLETDSLSTSQNEGRDWADLFMKEMLSASDMSDARVRAKRLLEAFERAMASRSESAAEALHKENSSMKEQLHVLLRENQVLKRAVAIQHERRQGEQEKCAAEVEHLKQLLSHQQEHVRALELNNYALNVHLRQFQAGNALMERFHPDVF